MTAETAAAETATETAKKTKLANAAGNVASWARQTTGGALEATRGARSWVWNAPARMANHVNPTSFQFSTFAKKHKILTGMAGLFAVGGLASTFIRKGQESQVEQGIQMAQQEIQAAQAQAIMQMQQAQAGGMMPNSAAPQIMGTSAQHMGMMDAAPELVRG